MTSSCVCCRSWSRKEPNRLQGHSRQWRQSWRASVHCQNLTSKPRTQVGVKWATFMSSIQNRLVFIENYSCTNCSSLYMHYSFSCNKKKKLVQYTFVLFLSIKKTYILFFFYLNTLQKCLQEINIWSVSHLSLILIWPIDWNHFFFSKSFWSDNFIKKFVSCQISKWLFYSWFFVASFVVLHS